MSAKRKSGSPVKVKPRPRDREATRTRILRATGRVLSRRGFGGLGINSVAAAAGVDKVLIYRYFGGLPELLVAFARQAEFWPQADELLPEVSGSLAEVAAASLKALLRALRRRPETQEVLRWELSASSVLVRKLAAVREEQGLPLLSRLPLEGQGASTLDVPAIAALLTAGITHLVLSSKTGVNWLGVSLRSEEGQRRIERAIDQIVDRVLGAEAPGSTGGAHVDPTPRAARAPRGDRARRRPPSGGR